VGADLVLMSVVTQVANMNSDKIYDIVLAVMQVKLITVI
jgi:hypothetical protein